jgi:hypothetical protein
MSLSIGKDHKEAMNNSGIESKTQKEINGFHMA